MGEVLVGRTEELARLRAWLHERLAGAGPPEPARPGAAPPLLLVGGEAGIGKTALVEAALTEVTEDAATVGRAPVRVVRIAVRAWTRPGSVLADLRSALDLDGPVVVVLEDLHEAGADSLEPLPALVSDLLEREVAVVATYRPAVLGPAHPWRAARAVLRHARLVTETSLGPLGPGATADLVAARHGAQMDPGVVEAVVRRSDGVPLLAEALVEALVDAVGDGPPGRLPGPVDEAPGALPEAVLDAVLLQVARLDGATREALGLAALAGPEVDVTLLGPLLAGGWPDSLEESELLERHGDGGWRFRHELVRAAVVALVAPARRRAWQQDLAQRHLGSGHPREALDLLLRAGACDAGPPAGAAGADAGTLAAVATAAEECGEHAIAARALGGLLATAPEADRAPLLSRSATQRELLGQWSVAVAEREACAHLHEAAGRPDEAAVEWLAIALHLRSAASLGAALEVTERARSAARSAGRPDLLCRAEAMRGNLLARTDRGAEGVAQVRSALDHALAAGLLAPAAEAYQRLADALEHTGDYRSAAQAYDAAYTFCRHGDQDVTAQVCRACASVVMLHGGRWDTALEVCSEVLHEPASPPPARAAAETVAALVEVFRGRVRDPRAALLGARLTGVRIDLLPVDLLASWGLSLLDRRDGDDAGAVAGLRRVVQRCEDSEERHYCVPVLQDAVGLFGRHRLADDLGRATTLLAEADRRRQPDARIALCVALAETAALPGGPEAAVPHLRQGLDLCADEDLPLVDVDVRRRLARALVAGSPAHRDEAVELLRHARRTARRLRARLLLAPLEDELSALGASPAPGAGRDEAGDRGLTAREREVLELVGDGLTSRQIAARLFLSARTVEMHVRHAMTKLDCRTRTEAVLRIAVPRNR